MALTFPILILSTRFRRSGPLFGLRVDYSQVGLKVGYQSYQVGEKLHMPRKKFNLHSKSMVFQAKRGR